jgi:hypothetical protein
MKKLILLSAAMMATAIAGYSQGTIVFANPGQPITDSRQPGTSVAAAPFRVALYWLPDQATAPTTADFDAAGSAAIALESYTLAAPGTFARPGSTRIEGVTPAGGFAWLQVRAWEVAFGANYATASTVIGAMVGTSTPFRIDTGNPTTTPAGTPAGIVAAGFKSFAVFPVVPEPTAIGLGLLGLGSLLFLRRRK